MTQRSIDHECTKSTHRDETVDLTRLLAGRCVYCGSAAQGNYSIHRDGFGVGPEVPLCDDCGGYEYPTCAQIWARISEG